MTCKSGSVRNSAAVLALAVAALPGVACAKPGDPVPFGDGLTFDPIIDARIRYENVDQPTADADAVTARLRAGFELKHKASGLSFLAEAEGTLGIVTNYNDTNVGNGVEPYSVVADPQNIELNRLQIQYVSKPLTVTVGRQRILLDDQRFVGNAGWRQNEQTFDAVRGEARLGPVTLDGSYAIAQRTVFGGDAGPREAYTGDLIFLGAGVKQGPVTVRGFAYLLDFDEAIQFANSSQTYGLRAVATIPLGKAIKLNLAGSYAKQRDYGSNLIDYSADYVAGEAGTSLAGFTLTGGYEKLGEGGPRAFQTPLATLHKFNGWADLFLTTPATGLQDAYVSVGRKFDGVKLLPGLNASVAWHQFDSDRGDIEYGTELDALVGFKVGPAAIGIKYADYQAVGFAVDTRKFWLQAELAF